MRPPALAAGAATLVLLAGCGSSSSDHLIGDRAISGKDLTVMARRLGCQPAQTRVVAANGRAKQYSTQVMQCAAQSSQYIVFLAKSGETIKPMMADLKRTISAPSLPYLYGKNWAMVATRGGQDFTPRILTEARGKIGGTVAKG